MWPGFSDKHCLAFLIIRALSMFIPCGFIVSLPTIGFPTAGFSIETSCCCPEISLIAVTS